MKLLFCFIVLFAGITTFAQEKEKKKLAEWFKHLNGDSLIVSVQKPTVHSNMPMVKPESKDPMPNYSPPDSVDYKIGKYKVNVEGDSARVFKLPKLRREQE